MSNKNIGSFITSSAMRRIVFGREVDSSLYPNSISLEFTSAERNPYLILFISEY